MDRKPEKSTIQQGKGKKYSGFGMKFEEDNQDQDLRERKKGTVRGMLAMVNSGTITLIGFTKENLIGKKRPPLEEVLFFCSSLNLLDVYIIRTRACTRLL